MERRAAWRVREGIKGEKLTQACNQDHFCIRCQLLGEGWLDGARTRCLLVKMERLMKAPDMSKREINH